MRCSFLEFLKMNEVEYKEKVFIREISPVRIGGIAKVIVYPDNFAKMILTVNFLVENKITYKVVGRISNILFRDEDIGIVLIKTDRLKSKEIHKNRISLFCGDTLYENIIALAKEGYGGISELSGIPGSIGGMIAGNAGAFGKSISDVLSLAEIYIPGERKVTIIKNEDIMFEYRNSIIKQSDFIILRAEITLESSDFYKTLKEISHFKEMRCNTQPVGYPSLGSVFKRPEGRYAAKLIEDAGLKGMSCGDMMVSEKHAGFFVNTGAATSRDFRMLIEKVKNAIYEKYGIKLEEEIEIL